MAAKTKMIKTKDTRVATHGKTMSMYYDLSRRANSRHKFKKTKAIIWVVAVSAVVLVAIVILLYWGSQTIEKKTRGSGDIWSALQSDCKDVDCYPATNDGTFTYISQATVAAEDEDFFNQSETPAVLTQKLAELTYIFDDKTVTEADRRNKINNYAVELEKNHSKDQILLMFLDNNTYGKDVDGEDIIGVRNAAYKMFGRNVEDLTLNEAVTVAVFGDIGSSASMRDILTREDEVFDKMAELGYMSKDMAETMKNACSALWRTFKQ